MSFHVPNKYRIREGAFASTDDEGNNGAFEIPILVYLMKVIASDHEWEHVSVSLQNRYPTWSEMCFIKNLFWDEEDCVVKFHPPKSQYVNNHPYCLHLWRKVRHEFETPPTRMIGVK